MIVEEGISFICFELVTTTSDEPNQESGCCSAKISNLTKGGS